MRFVDVCIYVEKLFLSTECLLEAIKITLECNYSTFNKNTIVTAMGPQNACSYADLAMTTTNRKILHDNNRPNDVLFPHQIRQDSVTTALVFGLTVYWLY